MNTNDSRPASLAAAHGSAAGDESESTVEGTLAAFKVIMDKLPSEITVTVLATATREEVNKACHEAAFAHFGKEGEGSIHLLGLAIGKSDGINKTFILKAELRMPPNEKVSV